MGVPEHDLAYVAGRGPAGTGGACARYGRIGNPENRPATSTDQPVYSHAYPVHDGERLIDRKSGVAQLDDRGMQTSGLSP